MKQNYALSITIIYNIGGILLDKIIICCHNQCKAQVYNPRTNNYTAIIELPNAYKVAGHGYILTDKSVYQMNNNDINSWINLQYQGDFPIIARYPDNSSLFKRDKYLYFIINPSRIFQFNTESIELKELSNSFN